MHPPVSVKRRLFRSLMMIVVVACGVVFGLYKMRVNIPQLNTPQLYAQLDLLTSKAMHAKAYVSGEAESTSHGEGEHAHAEEHKVIVTRPQARDVNLTQPYVCQIHSQRHIDVCALMGGYLQEILVKEGQSVKKGDLLFKIVPTLYQARLDAENAEARLAALELKNTRKLFDTNVVSQNEVLLLEAKLAHAQAKAELAKAELNFTHVVAPFDGIVDRLHRQLGSLIKEGDILTTLSDNSLMWVYFNVPEAQYLEYMASVNHEKQDHQIELRLADGNNFNQFGKIGAIEAKFNNQTGNIPFRADFPNPDRLLRHGQTGTVLIRREIKNAMVIPQRATFEILDKRYVYVVDKEGVVHQREIVVGTELDDIYVVKRGVDTNDKILLEGMREVRDGEKVAYEFREPEVVVAQLKNRAE